MIAAPRRVAPVLALAALLACTPGKGATTAETMTTGSPGTDATTTDGGAATTLHETTSVDPPTTGGTTTAPSTTTDAELTGAPQTATTTPGSDTTDGAASSTDGGDGTSDTGDVELCEGMGMSSLPGVWIDFPPQPCTFTLAEVKRGVVFHFDVHVEIALQTVERYRQDAGDCDEPGPSGLIVAPRISGGDQLYCFCNQGLCPGNDLPAISLQPGVYPGTLEWKGHSWEGPHVDLGPQFPPGEYVVQEKALGRFEMEGAFVEYEVVATLPITLTP